MFKSRGYRTLSPLEEPGVKAMDHKHDLPSSQHQPCENWNKKVTNFLGP